ncbi:PD-(D/E)XK nuclease domain-containing protein [Paenibacillus medicaginis]|uniref:Uncharacterized protein n=1 Tax=Paenibacillus medicaginis TaxID=1470560 RepID=A0ABV5C393_9BACL
MPPSQIKGDRDKDKVIEALYDQINQAEQILAKVTSETPAAFLEASWEAWRNTVQKILQLHFSDENLARSFLLTSLVKGAQQTRRNEKRELTQSFTKSIEFLKGLTSDITKGLHDPSEINAIHLPTAIYILRSIMSNFHLHLKTMYQDPVHARANIKMEDLKRIRIGNEYDVQRILYGLIRPIFPEARMEVTEDAGYKSVRYDIFIDDYSIAIEIKCTRSNMSERDLTEELGADAFHYRTDHLFLFIYDKEKVVVNTDAFKKTYKRDKNSFDKNIETFVIQAVTI